jgi:hypothetical protein
MHAPRPPAGTRRCRSLAILIATVLSSLVAAIAYAASRAPSDACAMLRDESQFPHSPIDPMQRATTERQIRACLADMPVRYPAAWRILRAHDPRIFRTDATSELHANGVSATDILTALDEAAGRRPQVGIERPLAAVVALLVTMGIVITLYFLPTLVATSRGHPNRAAIFALNFLLGWTFLGWVVALVWSLTVARGARAA